MFNIKLKLYPASTMVDQATTKKEGSAHGDTTNERKVTQGKSHKERPSRNGTPKTIMTEKRMMEFLCY